MMQSRNVLRSSNKVYIFLVSFNSHIDIDMSDCLSFSFEIIVMARSELYIVTIFVPYAS